MPDVKWIKIHTDIFKDDKIMLIRGMPNGDSLFVLWVFLLVQAGRLNDGGKVYAAKGIAFSPQSLSTISAIPVTTIELGLKLLSELQMIEIDDDGIIILNWEKHQNIEGLEKIREQTKLRVQKHREKQKELLGNVTGNVTCNANTPHVTHLEDRYKNIERDIEEDKSSSRQKPDEAATIPYQKIVDLYHSICVSLPKVRALTAKRKSYIKARFKYYPDMKFWTEFFKRVEDSDFLTKRLEPKDGKNQHFRADLEWITNEGNFVKILEGKYDNREEVIDADKRRIIENIRRLKRQQDAERAGGSDRSDETE